MKAWLAYFLLLLSSFSFAQEDVFGNQLNIKLGYGALVPHRDFMRHLVTGHSPIVELSYGFNAYGKNNYDKAYLMPQFGFSALFVGSGNPLEIGNCYGLYPYLNLPLSKNKLVPKLRLGGGVGFVSKPFNPNTNQKNNAIGSHINACISIEFNNNFKLNNLMFWNYGFSLTHFSNGSFKLPNLGLNFITINTGVGYNLGSKKTIIDNPNTSIDKAIELNVIAHAGVRSNFSNSPLYPTYTLTTEATKRVTFKSRLLLGIDAFYNTSIEHLDDYEAIRYNLDTLTQKSDFQSGLYLGYGIVFNKFSINIINGIYTHNDNKERGLFYHRISLRKELGDRFYFMGGLKTHFAVAEYIEFGLGYKLH